jgi:hypothetical protein
MRRALVTCRVIVIALFCAGSVAGQEPTGACCYLEAMPGQPLCVIISKAECESILGGIYQGDGTLCTPNPCDCCGTDGTEIRGNANMQGGINIIDLTYMVGCAFFVDCLGDCFAERDVDGNGTFNIVDLSRLVQYLFMGGPPPAMCP